MTTTTLAPQFAFVLQHAKTIEQAARFFAKGTYLSTTDLASELKVDIIARWEKYDPERGTPKNWIYMRARAVRRGLVRQSVRNTGAPLSDLDALPEWSTGSAQRAEARAEVAVQLARATDEQRIAALSLVKDWSAERVRRKLGCSTVARTRKLALLSIASG